MQVYDWAGVADELDAHGCAMLGTLLSPQECATLAGLYTDDECFRSRVMMSRHGFGRGEYRYFDYPLPMQVAELRSTLYPRLAPIANRWNAAMGMAVHYRSEEHTSELQSLMRISYAVYCSKKKINQIKET